MKEEGLDVLTQMRGKCLLILSLEEIKEHHNTFIYFAFKVTKLIIIMVGKVCVFRKCMHSFIIKI